MIDPKLLREYNESVERAMNAYWRETSPIAEYERKLKKAEKSRRYKASMRTRKKAA